MSKNIHITHRKDGQWATKGEGDSRASGLFNTQRQAIKEGRKLAINNKSELLIHNRKNRIRARNSYGNDPESSAG